MSALDELIDMVEELEMEVQPARDELRQLRGELEGAKNGKQHADDEMKSLWRRLKRADGENMVMYAAILEAAQLGSLRCQVELQRIARSDALFGPAPDIESEGNQANHYARRAQEFQDAIAPLLAYRDANTLNFQLEKLDDYLWPLRRLMEKQP